MTEEIGQQSGDLWTLNQMDKSGVNIYKSSPVWNILDT